MLTLNFEPIYGTLIKRYKRFLTDVTLKSGEEIVAHCPNSGAMTSCAEPGWRTCLSHHDNPKRKLKYTWEMVHNGDSWIVTNTQRANEVAFDAISQGELKPFKDYDNYRREVKYGDSRIDVLCERGDELCYVEVKSVTLRTESGEAQFPDAVTTRGTKHLRALGQQAQAGHRAAMLYLIMREDVEGFAPAADIDPTYAEAMVEAHEAGVEMWVGQCAISPESIGVTKLWQWKP